MGFWNGVAKITGKLANIAKEGQYGKQIGKTSKNGTMAFQKRKGKEMVTSIFNAKGELIGTHHVSRLNNSPGLHCTRFNSEGVKTLDATIEYGPLIEHGFKVPKDITWGRGHRMFRVTNKYEKYDKFGYRGDTFKTEFNMSPMGIRLVKEKNGIM